MSENLDQRAIAYPNHQMNTHSSGVACAAGQAIALHPNDTLAECVLDAEQPETVSGFTFKVSCVDGSLLARDLLDAFARATPANQSVATVGVACRLV